MDTSTLLSAYSDINDVAFSAFQEGYPDAVIGATYTENSTGFYYKIDYFFLNQGSITIIMRYFKGPTLDEIAETEYYKMFFSMEGVTLATT